MRCKMLKTHRLKLRNLEKEDAEVIFQYRNDPNCSKYQRYDDTSISQIKSFIEIYSTSVFGEREEEQHFAVVRTEDNTLIGDLSVFFTEKDHCFTLGITISPKYQNNGYAYELLTEVIKSLHTRYPTTELVALIEKENKKSLNLFKKLGFIEECYSDKLESYVYTKNLK